MNICGRAVSWKLLFHDLDVILGDQTVAPNTVSKHILERRRKPPQFGAPNYEYVIEKQGSTYTTQDKIWGYDKI